MSFLVFVRGIFERVTQSMHFITRHCGVCRFATLFLLHCLSRRNALNVNIFSMDTNRFYLYCKVSASNFDRHLVSLVAIEMVVDRLTPALWNAFTDFQKTHTHTLDQTASEKITQAHCI